MLHIVRRGAVWDVMKVWLYAAIVIVTGAWASPIIYNAGKALGEVTSVKRTNGFLNEMGMYCRETGFSTFYTMSIVGMTLVWFIPFFEWCRPKGSELSHGEEPISKKWFEGVSSMTLAFMLALGITLLLGCGLSATRTVVEVAPRSDFGVVFQWSLLGSVLVVFLQEYLFRSMALGVFLRAMKPFVAITMGAVLYTIVILFLPPAEMELKNPDGDGVGFELQRLLLSYSGSLSVLLGHVLPLFVFAWVLGYTRWRNSSLWLPIGLHLGWKIAISLFWSSNRAIPGKEMIAQRIAGDGNIIGLLTLAAFAALGPVVHYFTQPKQAKEECDA